MMTVLHFDRNAADTLTTLTTARMVSTRAKKSADGAETAEKRAAPPEKRTSKKAKTEKDGKLEVNDGAVELKKEEKEPDAEPETQAEAKEEANPTVDGHLQVEDGKLGLGEAKQSDQKVGAPPSEEDSNEAKPTAVGPPSGVLAEPKHGDCQILLSGRTLSRGQADGLSSGTLESGHVYFLYRPKIETEEVDSVDDVSK